MRRYLPLALTMLFWGSAFATSKITVGAVPAPVAAALRFAGGSALLLAFVAASGRSVRPDRRGWAGVALLGALGVFGYNLLFFVGLALAPATDGSMIVPVLSPLLTTVASAVLGHERLPTRRVVGLAVAAAGAAVFFAGTPTEPGAPHRLLGDLVFVAAAVVWSANTLCGRPILRRFPPLPVTAYASVLGALALVLVALPSLGHAHLGALGPRFWLVEAYLMVFPTAVAFPLFYRGVHQVGPARAATMMFLVPVAGLICAFALLGETVSPVRAVGSAAMLAGAWLAVAARQAKSGAAPTDSGLQTTESV